MRAKIPSFDVLVVDDNPATRHGLKLLLSLEGDIGNVFEASEWIEVRKMVEEAHPDIVLVDVRMPGLSGIEIARRIKASDPEIHLVAMSMVADSEANALNAGADLFVEKSRLVTDIRSIIPNDQHTVAG
jgi:two-component system response regulator YesN